MGGRGPGCWACGTLGKSLPTSGPRPPAAKRAGWVNMTRPMVLCPFEEQPAPRGMGFTPSYVLPEPWGAGLCSSLFSLNPANICVFFFFFFGHNRTPAPLLPAFWKALRLALGPKFRKPALTLGRGQGGKREGGEQLPKKKQEKRSAKAAWPSAAFL